MIARMWRGWVRTEQASAYVAYITGTGLREYAATPGNLGCQMWRRDLGDGRTEILTVGWWESRAAIIGFAGSDIEAAVFYPEDDEYLVDRETTVSHFEVAAPGGRLNVAAQFGGYGLPSRTRQCPAVSVVDHLGDRFGVLGAVVDPDPLIGTCAG